MSASLYHPLLSASTSDNPVVSHDDIIARAREIWIEQGCPQNCDLAIWLEAEAELIAIQEKRFRHPHLQLTA